MDHPLEAQVNAFHHLHPRATKKDTAYDIYGNASCVRICIRASDEEFTDFGYNWKELGFPSNEEFKKSAGDFLSKKGFTTPIVAKRPSLFDMLSPNVEYDHR